ncbi:Short coiled-coil protein A [Clonorchis sinensis]|uniref:Short coiled-coil protein A n=2 Tax=Clonorchis sinensis TaxID=79923 RepID=A0A8T1MJC5_CLOSI|nr:Short coiled-coil protein A [Clonorchis sinensis]GAA48167.1 short coiled-coil protein [Clonorchis sinensis]
MDTKVMNGNTDIDANVLLSNEVEDCTSEADYEEKQRLIKQIIELQRTLEDLSARVDVVKEENMKMRSENQILGQYIETMMANSSVFQSTSPRAVENRRQNSRGF